MPKGKKYDAAEKHFIRRQEKYLKEIEFLKKMNLDKAYEIKALNDKIEGLNKKIDDLSEMLKIVMEIGNVSQKDIEEKANRYKFARSFFENLKLDPSVNIYDVFRDENTMLQNTIHKDYILPIAYSKLVLESLKKGEDNNESQEENSNN